jgi:YD repeat-containing protein
MKLKSRRQKDRRTAGTNRELALLAKSIVAAVALLGGEAAMAATYADCLQYGGTKVCRPPKMTPWRIGWGSIYYSGVAPPGESIKPYCRTATTNFIAEGRPNAARDKYLQYVNETLILDCNLDIAGYSVMTNCDTQPEAVIPFDVTIANRPTSPYSGKNVISLPGCEVRMWSQIYPDSYYLMPYPWREACESGTAIAAPSGKILCLRDKPEEEDEPPCDRAAGNPIDLATGNKFQAAVDYADGSGNLTFKRYYSSQQYARGSLDGGWSSEYDGRIVHTRDPSVVGGAEWISVYRGTGGAIELQPTQVAGGFVRYSKWVTLRATVLRDTSSAITGYLVNHRGNLERFDAFGRLERIVRKDGYTRTLAYDDNDTRSRVVSVTDSFGRKLDFFYDDTPNSKSWHIDRMKTPSGAEFQYIYNDAGPLTRLMEVRKPDGKKVSYEYDLNGRLTGIVDELGVRASEFGYGPDGLATTTARAGGVGEVTATRVPGQNDSVAVSATISGVTVSRQYESIGGRLKLARQDNPAGSGCAAASQQVAYDLNGNPSQVDRFGGSRSCATYDLDRNLRLVTIEGLSSSDACSSVLASGAALPAQARKVTQEWHPDFDMPVRVASPMNIATFVYNGQPDPTNGGQIAACAPGAPALPDGKPIAVLCKAFEQATYDADGSQAFGATIDQNAVARLTTFTYNARGQLLTQTDGRGGAVSLTYHPTTGTAVTVGDVQRITPAKGLWLNFGAYNKDGYPTDMSDANGLAYSNAYDSLNRVKQVTVAGKTTGYTYDDKGRMQKVTGFAGEEATLSYDDADRLIGVSDKAGNSITYVLDPASNVVRTEYKDPAGSIKRWIEASFDALNRLSRIKGVMVPRP